jgi:hypothetical protein
MYRQGVRADDQEAGACMDQGCEYVSEVLVQRSASSVRWKQVGFRSSGVPGLVDSQGRGAPRAPRPRR